MRMPRSRWMQGKPWICVIDCECERPRFRIVSIAKISVSFNLHCIDPTTPQPSIHRFLSSATTSQPPPTSPLPRGCFLTSYHSAITLRAISTSRHTLVPPVQRLPNHPLRPPHPLPLPHHPQSPTAVPIPPHHQRLPPKLTPFPCSSGLGVIGPCSGHHFFLAIPIVPPSPPIYPTGPHHPHREVWGRGVGWGVCGWRGLILRKWV